MARENNLKIYRKGDNNCICTLRVNETKDSLKGEVDVFVTAGTGRIFEKVTVQRQDRTSDYLKHPCRINAFSWHGSYLKKDGQIRRPKIHLKKDTRKLAWTELEGVINQKEIFLFPVFSIYVPKNLSFANVKKKSRGASQELVLQAKPVRIDFFLLPKDISKEKFMRLTISSFYLNYDITMFNRQCRGALVPLDGCEVATHWYQFNSWWSLVRCVFPISDIPSSSLFFHDTFDPIGCILDRGVSPSAPTNIDIDEEFRLVPKAQLRDLHEKELKDIGLRQERNVVGAIIS